MRRFIFRPTTADFRKWCKEYVGVAFSIVRTYERWPELSKKEEYEDAKKICRQYKVLLASLGKEDQSIFKNTLMSNKPVHFSEKEERMAFHNAFHNWQEICFPGIRSPISAITKEEIGARIKAVREQHCYTRKCISDVIGVSEATMKAYENGDRLLRLDTAYQLAQIYGITLDELIGMKSYY